MIRDYYQSYRATLFLFFLLSFSSSQNAKLTIELKNGNKITGELLNKTDSTYSLNTEFGQLTIPKKDISLISDGITNGSVSNNKKSSLSNSYLNARSSQLSLNQEARWRTIYAAMGVGNTLYGGGIPYLLDWDQDDDEYIGFRLLVFGATFTLSSSYTKNMDLPLGRSYLQFAGANLGFYSIVPIISVVGLKNWSEFDPDGKVALGYTMVSIPYGSILADRAYTKWNLSNGQSFLISLGINLGALNSVGVIQQTDWYSWSQKNPENFARWTTSLVYAGALVGGKIAKEIALKNSSITEGDVAFLNLSIGLGYLNSLVLGYAIELNHYKDQTMLTMAGVNGFLYLGNKLNKKYGSLSQGQEKIVALGAGAAYLAWVGTALLTGVNYGKRSARYLDAASITAGWYFSRINISSDFSKNDIPTNRKNEMVLAVSPILLNQNRTLVPGVSINLNF